MTSSEWAALGGASALLVAGGYLVLKQFGGLSGLTGNFPTTVAGFKGNVALMEAYLKRYPPTPNVYTPQNQIAYHLLGDISGIVPVTVNGVTMTQHVQYGYPVAGWVNQGNNQVVSWQLQPVPSGAAVYYYTLGASPDRQGYVLVGQFVLQNGQMTLWQVIPAPSTANNPPSVLQIANQWANRPAWFTTNAA